jgi:hypothetical protein
MLFGMVERGMGLDFAGDKGKAKTAFDSKLGLAGQDAMWAVILTKELWQKSIWSALPCYLRPTLIFQKERCKIRRNNGYGLLSPCCQGPECLDTFLFGLRPTG